MKLNSQIDGGRFNCWPFSWLSLEIVDWAWSATGRSSTLFSADELRDFRCTMFIERDILGAAGDVDAFLSASGYCPFNWELVTTNKNQEPLVRRAIWALIPTSTCQICRRNDLCSTLFCLCFRFQWQMPRSLRVNIWLLDGWHSWKNLSCIVVGHKRVDMNSICNRGWKTSTQFVTAGEKKVQVEDEASSDQPLIILRFYSNPTLL